MCLCGLALIKIQYKVHFIVVVEFPGFHMTEQDIHLIYSHRIFFKYSRV